MGKATVTYITTRQLRKLNRIFRKKNKMKYFENITNVKLSDYSSYDIGRGLIELTKEINTLGVYESIVENNMPMYEIPTSKMVVPGYVYTFTIYPR